MTKKVSFMGDEVEIRKLSVAEVFKVQDLVKASSKSKAEDSQVKLLRDVLRLSVVGAEALTDAEFDTFPIGELNTISEQILSYSGIGDNKGADSGN